MYVQDIVDIQATKSAWGRLGWLLHGGGELIFKEGREV